MGIGGYMLIEDYSLSDAFYMTIITVSTVGFGEIHPLSEAGRIYTAFLIIISLGVFAYGISIIAASVLSGELTHFFKLYRLENVIQNLSSHVIICGYGRNGRRAARKLDAYGEKYLVIEQNDEIIANYLENTGVPFIQGDATADDVLLSAGIERAKSIIATLSKDSDNLYVVISARTLNKEVRVISRASNESAEKKLKTVGANAVVMPEGVGGAHMATLVVSPNIVEFLEFISIEGSSNINLEEIEVSQISHDSGKVKLKDLQIRQQTGCSIMGIKTPEGEYIINPDGELALTHNSKLFVLGNPEEINKLNKILHE